MNEILKLELSNQAPQHIVVASFHARGNYHACLFKSILVMLFFLPPPHSFCADDNKFNTGQSSVDFVKKLPRKWIACVAKC